jgi:hypothetical protein
MKPADNSPAESCRRLPRSEKLTSPASWRRYPNRRVAVPALRAEATSVANRDPFAPMSNRILVTTRFAGSAGCCNAPMSGALSNCTLRPVESEDSHTLPPGSA